MQQIENAPADLGSGSASPRDSGSFAADWVSGCLVLVLAVVLLAVLSGPWILLAPALVLGVMGGLWWIRGRDPERRAVTPRYEPPEGLSPAEVGILVDHRLDFRDITAALVDLANRGLLEIRGKSASTEDTEPGKDYVFVRTSEPEEWESLGPQERDLLYALFKEKSFTAADASGLRGRDLLHGFLGSGQEEDVDLEEASAGELLRLAVAGRMKGGTLVRALYGEGRDEVRMSELEDSFYHYVYGLHMDFLDRLVKSGYYPGRAPGRRGIYFVAGVALFFFTIVSIEEVGVLWFLSGLITCAVVIGVGWVMPARTAKGARAVAQVRGFEEFLRRVEEDRFRRMIRGPEDFERFLPYAIALGVDRKWAKVFEPIYSRPEEERLDWTELRDRFRDQGRRLGLDRRARHSEVDFPTG